MFQAAGRGVCGPRSLERMREGGQDRGRDRVKKKERREIKNKENTGSAKLQWP